MNPALAVVRERRERRHALATRFLARAADHVAPLDWDALDAAPAWLSLPDAALGTFCCKVGAVHAAPALRLWIDGARIAAARTALGEEFLQAVLANAPTALHAVPALPQFTSAATIRKDLTTAGAGVLLASLPPGPLRAAAVATFAPIEPAPIVAELALATVQRARTLAENAA